jgi:hypothetical protein
LLLQLHLLFSLISNIFDIVSDIEEIGLEDILKDEGFALIWDCLTAEVNDFLPMAITDGVFGKGLNQRKDVSHIIN